MLAWVKLAPLQHHEKDPFLFIFPPFLDS